MNVLHKAEEANLLLIKKQKVEKETANRKKGNSPK
jgi:hypothetical protein